MTLEETIESNEAIASQQEQYMRTAECQEKEPLYRHCKERYLAAKQIADWLSELKDRRNNVGHWIHLKEDYLHCERWECSRCHKTTMTNPMYPHNDYDHMYYCPKCGAKMEEQTDVKTGDTI